MSNSLCCFRRSQANVIAQNYVFQHNMHTIFVYYMIILKKYAIREKLISPSKISSSDLKKLI